jgi:ABC-type cobalt transport system substrate-binding protein
MQGTQDTRRRWGIWAIVIVLVLLFAFMGLEGYWGGAGEKEVARVTGYSL